jgi:hypothetical protein
MPKKKFKKIISGLLLIILLGIAVYILINHSGAKSSGTSTIKPTGTINYSPPTPAEETLQNQTKQAIINNTVNQNSSSSSTPTISLSISRLSQPGPGDDIQLRTVINGATTGICNVTFTQGTSTFSQTFQVTEEATYSTCDSANIPASSFPSTGLWDMTVTVSSGSNISNQAKAQVNVT